MIWSFGSHLVEFIKKYKVEDHWLIKDLLLSIIESVKLEVNVRNRDANWFQDFNQDKQNIGRKQYVEILEKHLDQYIVDYGRQFGLIDGEKKRSAGWWFHQYYQTGEFGWHHHNRHTALIYFCELGDSNEQTEFFNIGKLGVEEGDVLLFPSYTVHRAPKITSNKRKTIFSTNVEFQVDRAYIEKVRSNLEN